MSDGEVAVPMNELPRFDIRKINQHAHGCNWFTALNPAGELQVFFKRGSVMETKPASEFVLTEQPES